MEKNTFRYIGTNWPTHDATEKATGTAVYTADLRLPGMLFAKMLFSPVPHAIIKAIDDSEAAALAGVHHIATCMNTTDALFNSARMICGHDLKADEQIFPRTVRYVGDRVAAVVADTEEIAARAVKLIRVEYQPLPAVFDIKCALADNAPALHEGGNLLGRFSVSAGDADAQLARAGKVFLGQYTLPAAHHFAMEPHASVSDYDGRNLVVWSSTQNIFALRILLADLFGLPVNRVRVIRPTVGGGFGGKFEMILEPVAALLAIRTARPVMLEFSRQESMVSTRTRHGATVDVKIGVTKEGLLQAADYIEYCNAGAYAASTMNVIGAASGKCMMLYRMADVRYTGLGVYTNSPVAGAMRGYGSPQIETAIELMMDRIAGELRLDPVELRLKNLVCPGDLKSDGQDVLGGAHIRECVEIGREMIGWTTEVSVSPDGRYRRAVGCACGAHVNGLAGVMIDPTAIQLKMVEDGSLLLFTGTQDIGQGNITVLKLIITEVLHINMDSIVVIDADTATTPYDLGTSTSRGTWVAGEAARRAAVSLLEMLRQEAADILGTGGEDLVPDQGAFADAKDPRRRAAFRDCVLHAQQVSRRGELFVHSTYYSEHNSGSYAADFAEVEVDTQTYEVKVLRFVAVHDVGRAINPMMLEGQIEGGIQMGLGYGLTEELLLDPVTGAVTNAHPKRYRVFHAADMPRIQIALVEKGEKYGPYGAKSVAEIATVAVGAAVVNAVNRALDIHLTQLPATPERIRSAVMERGPKPAPTPD